LVQSDDIVKHVQIKPKTRICTKKWGTILGAFRTDPHNQASTQPCLQLEVELNGTLRNSPTLCAVITSADGSADMLVPLSTPDGRPILMKMENAIKL
jgi:hypothetical protein